MNDDMKRLCDAIKAAAPNVLGLMLDEREAIARAVLAELRKPSDAMLAEGLHERNVSGTGPRGLPVCFARMIDAALA